MTACLAPQEIARYRAGDFKTEEELLAVEAHLDGCAACRQSLLAEISAAAPALRAHLTAPVEASACPDPTVLARYAEGRADATDIELVRTHCEDCPSCAQDLASRLAARPSLSTADSPTSPSPAIPMWRQRLRGLFLPNGLPAHPGIAAFALVLVAAMGALAVYRGMVRPLDTRYQALLTQQAVIERQAMGDRASRGGLEKRLRQSDQMRAAQEARMQQLDARLKSLEAQLSHPSSTTPSGSSVQALAAVEQALVTHRPTIDPEPHRLLALMQTESSQIRGGAAEPSSPAPLQPVGTLILEDHPTLRWKPGTGAHNDTVTIRRVPDANAADPNDEQKGANITGTTWKVEKPLQRGKRYRWQVVTSDGAVSAIGEFQVVDTPTAERLRRTAQEYSGQHLTLGILYAKAGLLDAAQAELTSIPQADPQFTTARELLRHLHASRSPQDPESEHTKS